MQQQAVADPFAVSSQQLGALRRSLDERLVRLEAALSGSPSGVSLEVLVLDLARAATDEAQAAAALACVDARGESGAALAAERARVVDLERALQEAQRLVDGHVAASALANDARVRAEERVAALSTEHAAAVAKCEAGVSELAGVRGSLSDCERAYRELQHRAEALQAEREAEKAVQQKEKEETRQVLATVKDAFLKIGHQKNALDERCRALEAELAHTRDALARSEAGTRL
jgi:chromosome segregation ATPase